ncbi:hypothetical protein LS73_004105 [Helicobacter muridarum]|uniref:NC domain n=1 Tax=Helicobacter muridarum TaxID=216 RepID=A0A377PSK3_9HELI|nr:lecithin retinol acyltransferase family protein [Helicobacter muridarum]TLE00598.1 hypothetical protein LS73_004105 [Helicobacter muridarum]STQ85615.1 NC domain [Helicobacter muridarum]
MALPWIVAGGAALIVGALGAKKTYEWHMETDSKEKIEDKVLEGCHLVVDKGLYKHHGIYAGEGKVIHYAGFTECDNILGDVLALGQKSCICETSLEVFMQENKCEIRYHKNSPFEAKEIVQRARDRLGEDKYNLIFNNCEHFVNWCIYDKEFSTQVMGWGAAAFIVIGIFVASREK